MAIKNYEDIMNSVKTFVGNRTDDEALAIIEDVSDTFNDLQTKRSSNEGEIWKNKYNENNEAWRKKYRDRFFGKSDDETEKEVIEETKEVRTFEDLFKERED